VDVLGLVGIIAAFVLIAAGIAEVADRLLKRPRLLKWLAHQAAAAVAWWKRELRELER
jgi:hypothetical protein